MGQFQPPFKRQQPQSNPGQFQPSPYTDPQSYMSPSQFQPPSFYNQPAQVVPGQFQPPYPSPMQPPRKRRNRFWITLSIIGGVLLFSCVVCSVAGAHTPTSETAAVPTPTQASIVQVSQPTPTDTPTPIPTPTPMGPAKVGGTIIVNDIACTLVSVRPIPGDEFNTPKAGNEYIVVRVKLVNKSSNEVAYNPLDFHVKSGTGNITDTDFSTPQSYTANNILGTGKLVVGGSVEGDIIFQVSIGDHKAEFTWQPDFMGNEGDNAWSLGLYMLK